MDIREEFIAFLQCKWGLSGENLAKLLLDALNDPDLPIEDCRGQGYDGGGSVDGCVKGLAAHILRLNPKALYTHCYSHRLNLSICDSLSIRRKKKYLWFRFPTDPIFFCRPYYFFNVIDRATLFSPGGCGLLPKWCLLSH